MNSNCIQNGHCIGQFSGIIIIFDVCRGLRPSTETRAPKRHFTIGPKLQSPKLISQGSLFTFWRSRFGTQTQPGFVCSTTLQLDYKSQNV